VLALLGDARQRLLNELAELADRRQSLEVRTKAMQNELEGVHVEVEAKRRMLELVEATEQQLAGQGQEEPHESDLQHLLGEAGTEVRGGGARGDWPFSHNPYVRMCVNSLHQRLPASIPAHVRPVMRRNLSPRGPSLIPCGRTTCCRC
jgi:hypothetical protein